MQTIRIQLMENTRSFNKEWTESQWGECGSWVGQVLAPILEGRVVYGKSVGCGETELTVS